jgi:cysteine synthase A
MTIVSMPHELVESDLYVDLRRVLDRSLFLKCEGFNFGASVKMRAAAAMISAAQRDGLLGEDSILVESSSGNLGVALSAIAASKGLRFVCVTDLRCNPMSADAMRAYGTEVVVIDEPDPDGGYLKARLDWLHRRLAEDPRYVWLDQYSNEANWKAHYRGTAPSILRNFPDVDVLFVGVGTAGTAMGCARYLADAGSDARVVAVDPEGSVSFGHPAGERLIPGVGAGVTPPLLDDRLFEDVVQVSEVDTIRMCRTLASHGLLFGGSTGTAVSGALSWLARHDPRGEMQSVCISPDLGERYLDTIYNDEWVSHNFGSDALRPFRARHQATRS